MKGNYKLADYGKIELKGRQEAEQNGDSECLVREAAFAGALLGGVIGLITDKLTPLGSWNESNQHYRTWMYTGMGAGTGCIIGAFGWLILGASLDASNDAAQSIDTYDYDPTSRIKDVKIRIPSYDELKSKFKDWSYRRFKKGLMKKFNPYKTLK